MKTYQTITILTICIFSFACCKKTQPTPPLSQTSNNYFFCNIVGDNFSEKCEVNGGLGTLSNTGVSYILGSSRFRIKVITTDPRKDFYLDSRFTNEPIIGEHKFNIYLPSTNSFSSSLNFNGGGIPTGSNWFTCDSSLLAKVVILKYNGNSSAAKDGDTVEGTFDIILKNNLGEQIHLKDGFFRIGNVD